ncbi:MAG: hypothetical protein IH876_12750 [Gemmatimonadetes bacterium]|nr:hypothetical protein [Gemmatimonadota bacterium]
MPEPIFRFAEALRALLSTRTPDAFEDVWESLHVSDLGWTALQRAWRHDQRYGETTSGEVDGLLLRLLDRVSVITAHGGETAQRVRTFRRSELERLQHAAAAALVAQRFGAAGLCTVLEDDAAPVARRYFSFFSLAERHPPTQWSLFATYLRADAHYAFVGAAAETARYYPTENAVEKLVSLFDTTRSDLILRTFLSPRILESLFVLSDPVTLPFFRGLLTSGYTDSQPEYCEVTRALVMVRRFTGAIEPSVKYSDSRDPDLPEFLGRAEQAFEAWRETLHPVVVI